jgi:hypothetical protein
MPWLSGMLDKMSELNPDDGAISYMIGEGAGHIDAPHMKAALNYIFYNTDKTACTWVLLDANKETYPSDVNTAWLLDTQQLHGISNTGERWALSIHFNAEYNLVKEWFDNHPNLIFGNTQLEK